MNIGLFTDTYYPQINGVATSTKILAGQLRKKGHKVYIFTTTDPAVDSPEFDVFRLPSVAFIFLKSHRASVIFSPKALSAIKKMNLDIVHTQTEFSLGVFGKIVALRLKKPHVHTFHTLYPDYVHYVANGHLVTPKMAENFCRVCCNVSKIVIAPTEKVRSFLRSVGVKKEIVIIPTGMDFESFKRENFSREQILILKQSLGIDEADKVIVTIGRIAKEKSMDIIVKAMPNILKQMPNVKLVIVGDGPLRKELENESERLSVSESIIFTGIKPWSEIGLYYVIGDLFVNASSSETQGLTFIEALAAKTPVLAKSDPCLDGIVENNVTGFLFNDNEELPKLVVSVLSNNSLLAYVSENGYDRIKGLSADNFADSVLNVYKSVIEGGGKMKSGILRRGLPRRLNLINKGKLRFFKKSKS